MSFTEIEGLLIDAEDPRLEKAREEMRRNAFEARELRLVKQLLRPGQRVMELGTCTGFVAMHIARIVGAANLVCYEANPDNVRMAQRHFAANGLDVTVHHAVLTPRTQIGPETPPTVPFYLSRGLVSSALTPAGMRRFEEVSVPRRCLEEEIARHRAQVLVLDIEGAEVELLGEGDLAGIDAIIMETHYRKAGVRATNAMIAALIAQGFRLDLRASASEVVHLFRAGTGPEAEEAAG